MPNITIPMFSGGEPSRRFPAITDSSQFSYPWRDDPSIPSRYPWWWQFAMAPDLQNQLARLTGFNYSPMARAKILENDPWYKGGMYYRDAPYIMNLNTPYEYDIRTKAGQYLATHPVLQNPNWRQQEEQAAAYAETQRNPTLGYFNLAQALLFALGAARAGVQGVQSANANAAEFEAMRANPAYRAQVKANEPPATINEARARLGELVRPNAPAGTTPTNAQMLDPANMPRTRRVYEQQFAPPDGPARIDGLPVLNVGPQVRLFTPGVDLPFRRSYDFMPLGGRWNAPPSLQPTTAAIDQARANLQSLLAENAVAPDALPNWTRTRFSSEPLPKPARTQTATAPTTSEPNKPVKGEVTVKGVKYKTVEEAKQAMLDELRKGSKEDQANAGNPAYTTKLEESLRTMAEEQYNTAVKANSPSLKERVGNWWSGLEGAARRLGSFRLPTLPGTTVNEVSSRAGRSSSSTLFTGPGAAAAVADVLARTTPANGTATNTHFTNPFGSNFVNPFTKTEEKDKQSLADREKKAAEAAATQQSGTGAGGTVGGMGGGGYGMVSTNDINAAFNKAMAALAEMQTKNKAERDAAEADMKNYGGQLDTLVNNPIADVVKQQEISPDASFMSSLAANIAAVLNPNINALGQRSQYVAEQNAKYGREHDELVRKHEDMKSERMFKYQALAEKYRRAADIYDKRGDTDRAMEMAAKHDDVLKRLDAIMTQQNKIADRQVQREEIASRKYATNVTNKDKQYLQMVNNLEQVAANYEKMAENEPKQAMKRQYAMLARQNRLKLQDIQEQGIAVGGDISKIVPNAFYPHEQAMKRFRSLNPAVADSAGFEREFRRTQGFSNDKDFSSTWGIPRGEFRLWALKQLAGAQQ